MLSYSTDAAVAVGTALKAALDGGKLYLFAGAAPADADTALDMVTTHTQVAIITNNDTGTGLTFDTPTNANTNKAASETWSGSPAFDGKDDGLTTLTPVFYRLCAAGDDGRSASTGSRVQGSVGGPGSGADLELGSATVSSAGAPVEIGLYRITFSG